MKPNLANLLALVVFGALLIWAALAAVSLIHG